MLRFMTAGESHGQAIIGLIESFPAGFELSRAEIDKQLRRRQSGFGRGKRMAIEKDEVTILSGVRHGRTLGSPIVLLIKNKDWHNWKEIMATDKPMGAVAKKCKEKRFVLTVPRPGHADLAVAIKYNTHDLRDVIEHASARETAARVACGAVAKQFLEYFGIRIVSHVTSIGTVSLKSSKWDWDDISMLSDKSQVRCVDNKISLEMMSEIKQAIKSEETLGGIFEVRAANLPAGLGSNAQWFTRLDSALAAAIMSIPSVKGVEIGNAFVNCRQRGSQVHDEIYYRKTDKRGRASNFFRRSNNAGGIEGGITNGAEIIVRGACKPIPTLSEPLTSVDITSKKKTKAAVLRADVCVVPAAGIVGEAMVAMVLASAFVEKFGGDSKNEIEANYKAYLNREF